MAKKKPFRNKPYELIISICHGGEKLLYEGHYPYGGTMLSTKDELRFVQTDAALSIEMDSKEFLKMPAPYIMSIPGQLMKAVNDGYITGIKIAVSTVNGDSIPKDLMDHVRSCNEIIQQITGSSVRELERGANVDGV